jgi:hypothetical protein
MTMDEIDRKSARISLPHSVAGTACSIYVVGNHTGSGWGSTPAELDNLRLNYLGSTNGTFEVLTRGAREMTSFIMTGKTTVTIAGKDSYTPVNVALRRMTAKVAVRTTVDNAFKTKMNGGNLVITSARIHNVPQQTYAFYRADFAGTPVEKSYVFTQEPGVNGEFYENLFYIHESGPAAAGDRVKLTLSGYFDTDGDPATTDDRTDAIYHVEINGSGGGEIKRNGYYRVNVLLKGLPGDGAVVTCTTADWEAPVTQNSSAGV